MVLPKELRRYLPTLDETTTSATAPTTDRSLLVDMSLGLRPVKQIAVRYQLQTWGGTRSAESRITDGFSSLRKLAAEGDILLLQRRTDSLNRFRMILVKKASAEYQEIEQYVSGRRWGALLADLEPVSQSELSHAKAEIQTLSVKPFALINPDVVRIETRQRRVARSVVFRETVRTEYKAQCAISQIAIATPLETSEVQSAHIVPISEGGSDDARNGLALTQSIHWAFDRGIIGVANDRKVYLPKKARLMPQNEFLRLFEGKPILEAKSSALRAHKDALAWHFEHRVKQWE